MNPKNTLDMLLSKQENKGTPVLHLQQNDFTDLAEYALKRGYSSNGGVLKIGSAEVRVLR